MLPYIFIFSILLLLAIISPSRHKSFFVLIGLCLLVLIGFRDISVGIDTRDYVDFFQDMCRTDYSSLLYLLSDSTEPLYIISTWAIANITSSYTLYLFIYALLPAYAIFKLQYWSSTNSIQAYNGFLVLFVLGIGAFFLSGVRQTMAMSIAILSFFYILDSKPIRFIPLILIAALFHNSAILFIIAYPLKKIRFNYLAIIGLAVALYLVSLIDLSTLLSYAAFIFNDRFITYDILNETLSTSGLIIQAVLFLFCLSRKKRLEELAPENNLLLMLLGIALVFQSMSTILAEMFRISMYFSVFYIVLLPRAIKTVRNKKIRIIVETGFCAVFLVYLFFISSTYLPDYKFSF